MDTTRDFLGRGLRFQPSVDPATGRFLMESGEEDIKSAIYIIVMTQKGERVMLPDFGCNIQNYVFELPDASSMGLLRDEIIDAIIRWEPRVINVTVNVDISDLINGKVVLDIGYTVRDTNNPNNLVFPYYLYEGVGVE